MLLLILCAAAIGMACGLIFLHWLGVAYLGLAMSAVLVITEPWDLLLIPKWFALLSASQFAYLFASLVRALWDERRQELSVSEAEHDQSARKKIGRNTSEAREATGNVAQALQGQRVLIVEDEPIAAAVLADEVYAAAGIPVGPVDSIAGALDFVEHNNIDGAVLDVKLVDGEVTPVALNLEARRVPFVIVSGVKTPTQITTMKPGVQVFRKPVLPSAPIRGLAQEIRRSRRRMR